MNKGNLVDFVAKDVKAAKNMVAKVIDSVFKGVTTGLKKDGKVQLTGFGIFSVSQRKERMGRNPRTGKPLKIPASRVPKFTAGKALKETIGGKKK